MEGLIMEEMSEDMEIDITGGNNLINYPNLLNILNTNNANDNDSTEVGYEADQGQRVHYTSRGFAEGRLISNVSREPLDKLNKSVQQPKTNLDTTIF